MNGLKLLEAYSSGDEESSSKEADVPLQSDASSTAGNDEDCKVAQKWDVLPLPPAVQAMFDDLGDYEQKDDPSEHGGKLRSFPHERGVWATFVYIEYLPDPEFSELVARFLEISKLHGIVLNPAEHLHISLTRTLKLRYHWIPTFVSALNAHLRHHCGFKVMFQSTEVYANEEKTRTFVGLRVHVGFDELLRITQKIDKSLQEFRLPPFHEEPSFHLSCASCVGDKVQEIELFMADLNVAFQSFAVTHPHCRTIKVKEVYCKSGNKLFCIPLKT